MVIVGLTGGLGNQLFQYALGRRIAYDRNLPLKLDANGFENYRLHAFSLQHFGIRQDFVSPEDIARLKVRKRYRIQKLLPMNWRSLIIERQFEFDPRVLRTVRRHIYLEGYWQSERYFKSIEPILRKELVVTTKPEGANLEMAERIQRVDGVSVHIRRGDYVSDKTTSNYHGVIPLEYYFKAVEVIAGVVANPNFFIFSDDPEWARQHFSLDHPCTYVAHNRADRNYEDLRLMSMCRHHIIANSSFSWWGAWLSLHPEKVVVAPAKWFNNASVKTNDLVPTEWSRV